MSAWVGLLWPGVPWKSGCFGKDNAFLQAMQECGTGLSLKKAGSSTFNFVKLFSSVITVC